jgi:predicted enzyme related to lactoylglutathione lyase
VPAARFQRFLLRTTDLPGARTFYEGLLEGGCPDIDALPEAALARGARPHWLGHVGVPDVNATLTAFLGRGATRLGPPSATPILRDPGGAILALAPVSRHAVREDVVWDQLMTSSLERAMTDYAELFGWTVGTSTERDGLGPYQLFAWEAGGDATGSMASLVGRAGVHPQWLYFFRVADLDAAATKTEKAGGLVLRPGALPNGKRVAVCDDPQGAAFGLIER